MKKPCSYPAWLERRNLTRGAAHLYERWVREQCALGAPPDSTRHPDHKSRTGQELVSTNPVKPFPPKKRPLRKSLTYWRMGDA